MMLTKGQTYDTDTLTHEGWTAGDNSGSEGYNWQDYFDRGGVYQGADAHGIEPTFADPRKASDMELWSRAYPDGDRYADTISVCGKCGAVVRCDTRGCSSAAYDSLDDAYDIETEALSDCYDGICSECDGDMTASVHEVANREDLEEAAAEREEDE